MLKKIVHKHLMPLTSQRATRMSFWCGVISAITAWTIVQDYMGQEAYLNYVRNHWSSAWVALPLELLAFAALAFCGMRIRAFNNRRTRVS